MKATLFALLLLSASGALAQSISASVRSSEPVIVQFASHPARASQRPLAAEQSILFTAANASAQGERPLWEVAKPAPEVPLGDIARSLREEHATAKKAVKFFEK
jgi:hypothetical protein